MSQNNQLSIFEIAKETIDNTVVNKIVDDIKIFNSANTETRNEMFKIAAQKSRVIEHYGAILYETANDLADKLDATEDKLSMAVNSGELSKESIAKLNSSIVVSGGGSRLKRDLSAKLMAKGMKPIGSKDKVTLMIERN